MSVTRRASVVVDLARSPSAVQQPVSVASVRFDDPIWAPRQAANRAVTLPTQLALLEQTGRLDNFRKAAGTLDGRPVGFYFNDSDVYKWLEAAAWTLVSDPDPALDAEVDRVIALLAAAQQPDGYLDTYYAGDAAARRWTELPRTHELYCAGHLIQAAIAHHRATGKTSLLEIARRFADLICRELGPAESGRQPGTDGHPEIEMALVELARETGDRRYLDQARYLLDVRGQGLAGGDAYRQDHEPFRALEAPVGHAVRFLYLAAGAADLYADSGDRSLLTVLERLWDVMTTRRIYVSGGLGARHEGEAFGDDYELPNARAYTETCAAIGSVIWSWRMLLLTGKARYAYLIEWTLYNAFLPGLALDGQAYFYVNPLADEGAHRRQPWFDCACCPPNIARTIASIGGYAAALSDDGVILHLYGQGTIDATLPDGRAVRLRQQTRYPWDGEIAIEVDADGDFAVSVRIPTWCATAAAAAVNGVAIDDSLQPGSYARIRRVWRKGDLIDLRFPMPVRRIEAHPRVVENAGRWALARGPLLYCLEQVDHPGIDLDAVTLHGEPTFALTELPSPLGAGVALATSARHQEAALKWRTRLYCSAAPATDVVPESEVTMRAIPYFAWANREAGPMRVWLRHD